MLDLALTILGIYTCFLTWGIMQERVSTTPYFAFDDPTQQGPSARFTHFVFLNLVQALFASVTGYIYVRLLSNSTLRTPSPQVIRQLCIVSFLSTIASPFGYEALRHVDYPTMILAKSSKLIPVVIMGVVLHRRSFAWYKYASIMMISLGVSIFMMSQPAKKSNDLKSNSLWGLFLLMINLFIDGATNSTQDNIISRYGVTGPEMMFFMNFLSSILMSGYLGLITPLLNDGMTSDLLEATRFLSRYPAAIYDVILFCICGAIGQVFIFFALHRFGSIVLVTVNVTRKMFSMLLSVVWFGHRLVMWQWIAVGMVFVGIGLDSQMSKIDKLASKKSKPSSVKREEDVTISDGEIAKDSKLKKRRLKRDD